MRVMTRGFLALALVLLTLAPSAFAGQPGGDGGDGDMSAPCGQLPGDHNAVTGIRACATGWTRAAIAMAS